MRQELIMLKWSWQQRQQLKMCDSSGFVILKKDCSIWLSYMIFRNSATETSPTCIERDIGGPCTWLFGCKIEWKPNSQENIILFLFHPNWFFRSIESVSVNKNQWCLFILSTKKIKIFIWNWKLNVAYDHHHFDLNIVFTMICNPDEKSELNQFVICLRIKDFFFDDAIWLSVETVSSLRFLMRKLFCFDFEFFATARTGLGWSILHAHRLKTRYTAVWVERRSKIDRKYSWPKSRSLIFVTYVELKWNMLVKCEHISLIRHVLCNTQNQSWSTSLSNEFNKFSCVSIEC